MKVKKMFGYELAQEEKQALIDAADVLDQIQNSCAREMAELLDEGATCDITNSLCKDAQQGFADLSNILTTIVALSSAKEI